MADLSRQGQLGLCISRRIGARCDGGWDAALVSVANLDLLVELIASTTVQS